MNTSGKVAFVTGAGRRVGRAIALELASAGFDVAVHFHRSGQAAREVQDQIRQMGRRSAVISGDLSDPATPERVIRQAAEEMEGFDVLVNSASTFNRRAFDQTGAGDWQHALTVNAVAPALLARAAAPLMRSRGSGRIVNLIDIMAGRAVKGYAAYLASKSALASITRSLALELAPEITVNGIAPGIALFPEDYDQATRDRLISQVPLKRAGTPEEVAGLVRFLVTQAGYITGAIIPIDGGRSIRM